MDILTLGKMNAMARNTDIALELMANHVYEAQSEICAFQATNIDNINVAVADGLATFNEWASSFYFFALFFSDFNVLQGVLLFYRGKQSRTLLYLGAVDGRRMDSEVNFFLKKLTICLLY